MGRKGDGVMVELIGGGIRQGKIMKGCDYKIML
jgi:hypothetical protein